MHPPTHPPAAVWLAGWLQLPSDLQQLLGRGQEREGYDARCGRRLFQRASPVPGAAPGAAAAAPTIKVLAAGGTEWERWKRHSFDSVSSVPVRRTSSGAAVGAPLVGLTSAVQRTSSSAASSLNGF